MIRSLERLHSADNLKQFPSTVFRALSEIIEGGGFSLDTVDLKTGEVISETSENRLMSAETLPSFFVRTECVNLRYLSLRKLLR